MPISETYNCDCLEYMRSQPDKRFDLAIADPPYGINHDGQKLSINKNPKHNRKFFAAKGWDKAAPEKVFFDELQRISKAQIIWGANHFISKIAIDSPCWLIWDKGQKGLAMADCELDKEYYEKGCERFEKECKGIIRTKNGKQIQQLTLF